MLYPLLDEAAEDGPAARRLLRQMKAADRAVLDALTRLRQRDPATAAYQAAAERLRAKLERQLQLRRTELLAAVHEHFDAAERKTLGDAVEALEQQLEQNVAKRVRNAWRPAAARRPRRRRPRARAGRVERSPRDRRAAERRASERPAASALWRKLFATG